MKGQKRFYKLATVMGEGPFRIALDGRPIKTPFKNPLVVDSRALAEAIADEWRVQDEYISPGRMTFTKLTFAAIDHVAGAKMRTIAEIARFAGSDLVCYRATEPASLIERQAAHFDPILAQVREMLGAQFITVHGITHHQQPPEALMAVAAYLQTRDALQLSGIRKLTLDSGSALVALAIADGRLAPEAAWTAAHIDEDWQIEQWGEDPEAMEVRDVRRREFCQGAEFLRLVTVH